jgi:hypothetical protein
VLEPLTRASGVDALYDCVVSGELVARSLDLVLPDELRVEGAKAALSIAANPQATCVSAW